MRKVAALFVETGGVYFNRVDVDPWDKGRDARNYAGGLPVVAHPPCQLWGRMAKINFARWGGEHNRPENDAGCFAAALRAVCTFGGVLEHPADTYAFAVYGLPKPTGVGWQRAGLHSWVCEVWQSAYGHRARKRTWLYYYGINPPSELDWRRKPGSHQIGYRDQRGKQKNKPTLGKREASATPPMFADALISLAKGCGL